MSENKLDKNLAKLRELLDSMRAAYVRIENAPVGMSKGKLNIGMVKKVNYRDIALTKRIPVKISDISNLIGMSKALKEIENYHDERVREECLKVLRVRQSEYFQRLENTGSEALIDAINERVKEMAALTNKEYVVLRGKKWVKIDYERGSGWLMVNIHTGDIHNLLGYGKVDPRHCIGNIFKMSGKDIILAANPWMEEYLK